MQLGGLFGGLYRLTEWITRLAVTNILFLLCSSPFVLIVFISLFSGDTNTALAGFLLALIVSPFTFFPAATAMFAMARKWNQGDTDVPLFKGFFRGYKENFKQGLQGGLFFALLFLVIGFNIRFYSQLHNQLSGILSIVFVCIFVLACISMFHFFSFVVHIRLSLRKILKNAFLLTLVKPGTTLSSIVATFAAGLATYKLTGIAFFFTGSAIAVMHFYLFNRAYSSLFGTVDYKEMETTNAPIVEEIEDTDEQ